MKNIEDLPADIYKLFDEEEHHEPDPENLEALGENIKNLVRTRLSKRDSERSILRFSNLGRPDRQLWYMHNKPELGERMLAKTFFKFMYGDVIEQFVLFLTKEAGHTVEYEQLELEVDGIIGHIDAVVDGVVTDVKSASPFGYKKFADRTIFENDPFGYIGQISGYAETLRPNSGAAFLVADKVHGDICVTSVSPETTREFEPRARIEHLKAVIASPDLPPRCYPEVPEGKSGNMKLGTNCSYCPFKFECYKDANNGQGLRAFKYYNGPVFLSHVAKTPMVEEIEVE